MILTVGNTKGGVGKTTLSVNIAIARAITGRKVWLVDGDRQGTSQTSIAVRDQAAQMPAIACSSYHDGATLRTQVKHQSSLYDDVIIDAGGRDSTALRAALALSDVLLVPFQPRSYDVWALGDIAELIDEAHSVRDGLKVYAVLNLADPAGRGKDNAEAAEKVESHKQFTYIDTPISKRKAFSNASSLGFCVHEMKDKDVKAINELDSLIASVFKL